MHVLTGSEEGIKNPGIFISISPAWASEKICSSHTKLRLAQRGDYARLLE